MSDIFVKFTKQDKALLDNLLRVVGRAKIELEGVEIILAADSLKWLSRLQKQIEEEAKKPPVQISAEPPIKTPAKKTKDK